MKCSRCGYVNRENAKFCGECGSKLEIICPHCKNVNQPGSRFCDQCGQSLDVASTLMPMQISLDKKLEKIQRYLPEGLTEKILSQKDEIEGERKQVTVMFCDIEGFTPLTERLGSERVYSMMNDVFDILIHGVHSYGGTVNKMTGDGIMALFGAPVSVEDAPQRAIRAALSIHQEMDRFNDRIKDESELQPLKMRIGIHTGSVVVGTVGNDLRVEFTAVGDTVNLASRMEGLAEPGTTYVTEDSFKLTKGRFEFEEVGERQVKGREAPVKVYQVIAPAARRMRFDVGALRRLTPFVGRERELELLLSGLEWAKTGRGQAYSIIGEAGVGKSRLLHEFRKAIVREGMAFFEGQCLTYGGNVAYHPIIDLLKSLFDIADDDDDYQVKDKVKRRLKESGVDEASNLPYILELLSVKDSGIDEISLSREAKKVRMIQSLKRILLTASDMLPRVIAIEDIHWVDRSSEEVLKHLLDGISGERVLLIFTYRPEFVHTWGTRSYHSQVNLNRLSNSESLAMVNYLLGTPEVEANLQELVLEKTEGIPFFIEEFIESLKNLGIIEKRDDAYHLVGDHRHITIPSTIQDIIMARVDSLPDAAKKLLQIGSAIEREFSYELVKQVAGVAEQELLINLSVLRDAELLHERGVYPKSVYVFKHALTREVVYDSILETRKKRLHVEVGNAIEEINRDNLGDYYAVLTEHLSHSTETADLTKVVLYAEMAAKKASSIYAYREAVQLLEKAIKVQEMLEPEATAKRCDLLLALSENLILVGDPRRVLDVEAPRAFSLAEAMDDSTRASRICLLAMWALGHYGVTLALATPEAVQWAERSQHYAKPNTIERVWADMNMGTVKCNTGDLTSGASLLGQALHFAKRLGDDETLWRAAYNWLFYVTAPQHAEERLRLAEELANHPRTGISPTVLLAALPMLCDAFLVWGRCDDAEQIRQEMRELAEQSEQVHYLLVSMALEAILATWNGQLQTAVEMSQRIEAKGQEFGLSEFARVPAVLCGLRPYLYLGKDLEAIRLSDTSQLVTIPAQPICLVHVDQHAKAIEMLKGLVLARQGISGGEDETPAWADVLLLEAAVLVGEHEAAALLVDRLTGMSECTTGTFYPSSVARHLGAAAALLGKINDARSYYQTALEVKSQIRPETALTRLQLAELILQYYPQEQAQALEHLDIAITEFRNMKMKPALERAVGHKEMLEA